MIPESGDAELAARLRQLPELAPHPSLWPRTEAEYLARHPKPRAFRGVRWAVAATLLAAVPLAVLLYSGPQRPLEAEQLIRIQTLDHELQRRIDEGASDAELAPLWEQRRALMAPRPRRASEEPSTVRI